jgi:Domain of unknown function (DUF4350)
VTSNGPDSKRRSVVLWALLGGAVVLVALIAGPPTSGPALDPRSSAGNGTKALVLLLRQLGATVDVTANTPGHDVNVAVVLHDELSADRRTALLAWAAAGGTLVVADPQSQLQRSAPVRAAHGFATVAQVDGPCPELGFGDVNRVATGGSLFLRLPPGATGCFPAGTETPAYLIVSSVTGQGRLVQLGGAGLFTNALLAKVDNSVLAVDLLLPKAGAHVAVLLRSPLGNGHHSLYSLLGRPMHLALFQLVVAFAVFAMWRGRRLGRPVTEINPAALAGSELVVASGHLLARTGRRDAAATILRGGLRKWLAARLGMAGGAPAEQLADAAAARTPGMTRERLLVLLEEGPVGSDAELIELAQSIERARQEVAHA